MESPDFLLIFGLNMADCFFIVPYNFVFLEGDTVA